MRQTDYFHFFIVGMTYKDLVGTLAQGPPTRVQDELIITPHRTGASLYVEIVFMMGDSLYVENDSETPIWGCKG